MMIIWMSLIIGLLIQLMRSQIWRSKQVIINMHGESNNWSLDCWFAIHRVLPVQVHQYRIVLHVLPIKWSQITFVSAIQLQDTITTQELALPLVEVYSKIIIPLLARVLAHGHMHSAIMEAAISVVLPIITKIIRTALV